MSDPYDDADRKTMSELYDEIELLRGQLLSSYARIDELESQQDTINSIAVHAQAQKIEELKARVDELEGALRGYVKATTGQESATVTFPMALEGEET